MTRITIPGGPDPQSRSNLQLEVSPESASGSLFTPISLPRSPGPVLLRAAAVRHGHGAGGLRISVKIQVAGAKADSDSDCQPEWAGGPCPRHRSNRDNLKELEPQARDIKLKMNRGQARVPSRGEYPSPSARPPPSPPLRRGWGIGGRRGKRIVKGSSWSEQGHGQSDISESQPESFRLAT